MNTSEQINELAAALAKAQGSIGVAKKDAFNPHYKAKYADLASVWDACRKALSENGLSVIQATERCEKDEVIVTTRLLHGSGQWTESVLALPVSRADAQGFGSALTYARRYGLAAIVGVAPDEDDGQAANAAKPDATAHTLDPGAEADLLASLDEATDADDLRERLKKALAVAHEGGDIDAFKRIKACGVKLSERWKATVQ